MLQCDTVLSGGTSEGSKVANLASANHILVSPQGSPHIAVDLLPILAVCADHLGTYSVAKPDTAVPVKDDYIEVPNTSGPVPNNYDPFTYP